MAIAAFVMTASAGFVAWYFGVRSDTPPLQSQAVVAASGDSSQDTAGGLSVDTNDNGTQQLIPNSNQSTNNSTASGKVNPFSDTSTFKEYEKYKNDQAALYRDLSVGNGDEAVAGKKVAVLYRGWLTDGTLFDESKSADTPFVFTLGKGEVIPGWEQTIAGMKVGGERMLIIPPSVGYGSTGQGPIPGGAVLIFYAQLVGVQ